MTGEIPRPRILWVAEAVTLAHLARPLAASQAIANGQWLMSFACDPRYHAFLRTFPGKVISLSSIEPDAFLTALSRGAPLYDEETLEAYVKEDLEVIARVNPDVVIGDFRLSLSVSARIAKVHYIALANAYWSPYYKPRGWPVPQLPLTRVLPIRLAEALFRFARPTAFAMHSRPLNRVRRRHGLHDLGLDLRTAYTDADEVLYADLPELFPIPQLPLAHRFSGPAIWEPACPVPDWWNRLPDDRPLLYVTLGSSGQAALLPSVVATLGALDVTAVVATAGRITIADLPPNVHASELLPGIEAARRASLVICNGGSLTSYQGLSAGVPILGLPGNLDQFLNMQAIGQAGAGLTMRADRFSANGLASAIHRMLRDGRFRTGAQQVSQWSANHSLRESLLSTLCNVSQRQPPRGAMN